MSNYIQSFYEYPVTFSSIGKAIPSKDADGDMRNIVEITDAELEKLKTCEPFFRALVDKKKYRVLNKIPESYKPAAVQINEAKAELEAAKAELEAVKAELEATKGNEAKAELEAAKGNDAGAKLTNGDDLEKMNYKDLQEKAKELGLEKVTNVSKDDLITYIKSK